MSHWLVGLAILNIGFVLGWVTRGQWLWRDEHRLYDKLVPILEKRLDLDPSAAIQAADQIASDVFED